MNIARADIVAMTAPREILPGRTYLITRRCTRREFLLRPDEHTNAVFAYCLGVAASRFNIGLVAWLAMSNHYHAVVYDPDGRLPAFLEHFHKMIARVLNVRWERRENLWSTEETCVTRLVAPRDIFDKVVYVLTNPINDDVVDRVVDWPGFSSLAHAPGTVTCHERPRWFFSDAGRMPERVSLQTMVPPCIEERESAAAWWSRLRAAVDNVERCTREARLRDGRRVFGRKRVLRASPFDVPATIEPPRTLRPQLACKDREQRIHAIAELIEFYARYAAARLRFIAGDRDVEFPAGTYRMRAWGARCAPFPFAA